MARLKRLTEYMAASKLRTSCRNNDTQAGPIGFLIPAPCCQHDAPLPTGAQDCSHIAKH
ncbi:MAG: hypothetical protein OJF47_002364 [Nitrospira sp.]|nr:MAG: hypothetical protein OJF47_002364 [Nitrospira sp.]